jgi:NitT/TauT family transport system permease protein
MVRLAVVPVTLFILWLIGTVVFPSAFATPSETILALREGARRGWLQSGLQTTMTATFAAAALATVAGVVFSIVIALNKFWGDVWEPVLVWLYSVPKVTLFPVVVLIFGISLETSIAFGFINGVLPVAFITFGAIRSVSPIHLRVARVYGLSRWQTFREVVFPVATPSLVTAARYGFSTSFLAVVVGEMLASRQGIGQELFRAIGLHDLGKVFGIALALSVIALLVNSVFLLVQRFVGRPVKTGAAGVAR